MAVTVDLDDHLLKVIRGRHESYLLVGKSFDDRFPLRLAGWIEEHVRRSGESLDVAADHSVGCRVLDRRRQGATLGEWLAHLPVLQRQVTPDVVATFDGGHQHRLAVRTETQHLRNVDRRGSGSDFRGAVVAQPVDRPALIALQISFIGDQGSLAVHQPLEYSVRCLLDQPFGAGIQIDPEQSRTQPAGGNESLYEHDGMTFVVRDHGPARNDVGHVHAPHGHRQDHRVVRAQTVVLQATHFGARPLDVAQRGGQRCRGGEDQ